MWLPAKSLARVAASINARSLRPSSKSKWIIFDRGATISSSTFSLATRPAAAPATVGSICDGKTLFVPVDMGTKVTSGQDLAIVRFVPSPPKVINTLIPKAFMARAALAVSVGSTLAPISRISISASTGKSSSALLAMPKGSFMATIFLQPPATAPTAARAIRFRLSSVLETAPRAATRRISRPDTGLAIMPIAALWRVIRQP